VTDFDASAKTWDDPQKIERAEAVAGAIRRSVPLAPSMRALEYGAGTGLLSFSLRDALGPITLADPSAGMREVAAGKIEAAGAADMRVVDLDFVRDPLPAERYELIFSLMTLHHVPDVPKVLAAFHALLGGGGWLAVADLDGEDGSFHGEGADVHHGFERGAFRRMLEGAGFADVEISDCYEMSKGDRTYSMFLACARKPQGE
jgi:ubiquinone/menaquinone biosynthesis C-methylase UbiE